VIAATLIHVVDDEDAVRRALCRLLRAHGYAVQSYASVDEFLARPADQQPACVIADLRMPDKTGLDLLDAVGATKGRLPVVMITGHGDRPMVLHAMKAGASEVLLKPIEESALLQAIQRAVGA
jgi:FixJ family two-component response regulator